MHQKKLNIALNMDHNNFRQILMKQSKTLLAKSYKFQHKQEPITIINIFNFLLYL
jgi:hypothetical protein